MLDSMLLGLIQQQVYGPVSSSQFTVSDNLLNGISLHGSAGEHLSSFANATGGITVDLGPGTAETATITENFYGGHTIDFSNPTMADIVGRPGLFGSETFYQGGSSIGILEPSLLGDGMTLTTDVGTIMGSAGLFDTVTLKLKGLAAAPTYMADFGYVASTASTIDAVSVADSFAVIEGLDGLDGLDVFDLL